MFYRNTSPTGIHPGFKIPFHLHVRNLSLFLISEWEENILKYAYGIPVFTQMEKELKKPYNDVHENYRDNIQRNIESALIPYGT